MEIFDEKLHPWLSLLPRVLAAVGVILYIGLRQMIQSQGYDLD